MEAAEHSLQFLKIISLLFGQYHVKYCICVFFFNSLFWTFCIICFLLCQLQLLTVISGNCKTDMIPSSYKLNDRSITIYCTQPDTLSAFKKNLRIYISWKIKKKKKDIKHYREKYLDCTAPDISNGDVELGLPLPFP